MKHEKQDRFRRTAPEQLDADDRAALEVERLVGPLPHDLPQTLRAPGRSIVDRDGDGGLAIERLHRLAVLQDDARPQRRVPLHQDPTGIEEDWNVQRRSDSGCVEEIVGGTLRRQLVDEPQGLLTV